MQAMSLHRILTLIALLEIDATYSAVIPGRASFALNFNSTPGLVKAYFEFDYRNLGIIPSFMKSSHLHPYYTLSSGNVASHLLLSLDPSSFRHRLSCNEPVV